MDERCTQATRVTDSSWVGISKLCPTSRSLESLTKARDFGDFFKQGPEQHESTQTMSRFWSVLPATALKSHMKCMGYQNKTG